MGNISSSRPSPCFPAIGLACATCSMQRRRVISGTWRATEGKTHLSVLLVAEDFVGVVDLVCGEEVSDAAIDPCVSHAPYETSLPPLPCQPTSSREAGGQGVSSAPASCMPCALGIVVSTLLTRWRRVASRHQCSWLHTFLRGSVLANLQDLVKLRSHRGRSECRLLCKPRQPVV